MKLLQSFAIAMSMYSKIPMPKTEWNQHNMKYALCFFPVVGIVTGIFQYLAGKALIYINCGTLFFAAVMTLLPVCISGGIHLDGFMDTMDALSSYGDREKKLMILKDSNSGAFAILGMGCYFIWNIALWSEVKIEMLPVISCGYVLSRALSGWSVVTFPAARDSGLAKTFQDGASKKKVAVTMLLFMLAAVGVMLTVNVVPAVSAMCSAALVFKLYHSLCIKQFGGITGDLAGFFLQLCELAMLTGIVLMKGFIWK